MPHGEAPEAAVGIRVPRGESRGESRGELRGEPRGEHGGGAPGTHMSMMRGSFWR